MGRPASPMAQGGLTYPPVAQRYPTPVPVQGSVLQELSPGVYQTLAYPLPPELAAGIQFQVAPGRKAAAPAELLPRSRARRA